MTDGTTAVNWAVIGIVSTNSGNSCECGCDGGKECPNTCKESEEPDHPDSWESEDE